jgi:hypothetical protein
LNAIRAHLGPNRVPLFTCSKAVPLIFFIHGVYANYFTSFPLHERELLERIQQDGTAAVIGAGFARNNVHDDLIGRQAECEGDQCKCCYYSNHYSSLLFAKYFTQQSNVLTASTTAVPITSPASGRIHAAPAPPPACSSARVTQYPATCLGARFSALAAVPVPSRRPAAAHSAVFPGSTVAPTAPAPTARIRRSRRQPPPSASRSRSPPQQPRS